MRLSTLLLGTLVLASSAAAAPAVNRPLEQRTAEYFNNFYNPVSFYADDATLRCATSLPFGGEYHHIDGINEFFAKLSATVKFSEMQFETKYLDARNGRVKAETKFLDGMFRGPLVDDATRRFSGDKSVNMVHHLEFDVATGKLHDHTIMLHDPEAVQRMSDPKALKHFRALTDDYLEGHEELAEDSPVMDLVDDNVKVNVNLHPKTLLDGKREWRGTEELLEFHKAIKGDDTKPTGKGRRLLQVSDAMKNGKEKNTKTQADPVEVIYADANKVEVKTSVEEMVLGNTMLRNFYVYKTFTFDDDGLLTQMDIFFSRGFEPWELIADKQGVDGKKEDDEKPDDDGKKPQDDDTKPEDDDTESEDDGTKPEDEKPEDDDDTTEIDNKKPEDDDKKPEDTDTKPEDKKPEDDDNKTENDNKKPDDDDKKPEDTDTKPEDNKPEDDDNKPEDTDKKPEDKKPEDDDNKPENDDKEPADDDTKPADDKKPDDKKLQDEKKPADEENPKDDTKKKEDAKKKTEEDKKAGAR